MAKSKEKKMDTGLTIAIVCGIIAILLIVACVFFPDAIFGIFLN